jgi:outer membrane protein OmpA-like peptidoglycan-associated protein
MTMVSQTKPATKPVQPKATTAAKAFKGKLMIEFYGQTAPLVNALISITTDGKVDSTTTTRTDKYGDFEVTPKSNSGNLGLYVEPATKEVTNIVLANQQGVEIARMKRGPGGFTYKLLSVDITKLTESEAVEDITIIFNKFKSGAKSDLQVIEAINYGSDEYKVTKTAQMTLDKIVKIMKENPTLKLEIVSHTDARGDDKLNMTLSQKRSQAVADYLAAGGIDNGRLTATGKGETMLRNRCLNKVDCSEKEQSYNRRTEFNFTK